MALKKVFSSRELTRWGFLLVALAIFFIGPRFVESPHADAIEDTVDEIRISKNLARVKMIAIAQLKKDAQFAKENANPIDIGGRKMPAVYWLALAVLAIGFLLPLAMKYLEAKKAPPGA